LNPGGGGGVPKSRSALWQEKRTMSTIIGYLEASFFSGQHKGKQSKRKTTEKKVSAPRPAGPNVHYGWHYSSRHPMKGKKKTRIP